MKRIMGFITATAMAVSIAACGNKENVTSEPSGGASISMPPKTPTVNDAPAPALAGDFTMDGPAPVTGATYDSMPYELPLNPAGPQDTMVRWVDGWGVNPANAERGTMYVLGHAWGKQKLVFNSISEVVTAAVDLKGPAQQVPAESGGTVGRYPSAVLNGSTIRMSDQDGRAREWVVDNAYLVDKYDAIEDKELVNEHAPGRIVLIACSVSGTQDLGYNVIVTGQLAK
ncbi:hypothetical protein QVA66_08140 [Staphylococcus chromogenes]|nr:hypothetical protein [Staphylococcus chromogenes]